MNAIGSTLLKRLVLAVIAVVSLAAVLSGCSLIKDAQKSDTAKSKVGDCINVKEASMREAKTEPVDCAQPEAVYKVVSTHDSKVTCDKEYTSYTETRGSSTTAYLCLAPNYKEGQCYKESFNSGDKWVPCGKEASFKILKKVEGVADESACDKVSNSNKYATLPKEKITFCLGKP